MTNAFAEGNTRNPASSRRAIAAAAVGALTLLCKIGGFGRELLLARYFGTSMQMDALLLAMMPSMAISAIVGDSLRYSVIPELSSMQGPRGIRNFWTQAREITMGVAGLGLTLSLVLGFGARMWVGLLVSEAPAETRALATRLAPVFAPIALAALTGNVLAAVHTARGRVVRPSAAEVSLSAVSLMAVILFGAADGIAVAAWGLSGGYLAYASILALPLIGRRLPRRRADGARVTWIRSTVPALLCGAMLPAISVIDRSVASSLPEGSIAALNYAFKIAYLPVGIVVSALAATSFPELASRLSRRDRGGAAARLRGDLAVFVAIVAPIVVLLSVLALPVTRALFQHGAFGRDSSSLTASCLRGYAGAIASHALVLLLFRGAMAGKWPRIPVVGAATCISLNAALDFLLVRLMGAPGIGLAFTIANAAAATLGYVLLRRELTSFAPPLGLLGRVLVASALMAVVAVLMRTPFSAPLFDLLARGAVAAVALGLLYHGLGVTRSCATIWSGHLAAEPFKANSKRQDTSTLHDAQLCPVR
jgi:putative peptidoglycan lipid II flippase